MKNLLSYNEKELKELAVSLGEKAFRGAQLYSFLMAGKEDFAQMQSLPGSFRQKLIDNGYHTGNVEVVDVKESVDTEKYLIRFQDGELIEAVRMRYDHGISACVSTQAGCAVGCTFCATGQGGFRRNLTAGEILSEIMVMNRRHPEEKVTHVVLMGMGEPFLNYDAVLKFMALLHDEKGQNISYRRMTLSSSGIVPGILKLAEEDIPVTLSISLHSADDTMRSLIMPINKKYPLQELISAVNVYTEKTGRRVTYEYILIAGMTDRPEDAEKLIERFAGTLSHVNLIPMNPVDGLPYKRPSGERITAFRKQLEEGGVQVTVRREMGKNIDAACGQLRGRYDKIK